MTEPVNVTLDIASYGMPVPEFIDWIRGGLGGEFAKVADDIEAQVRPEEPLGFGTIVRVANGMMVVRIGAAMRTPWRSGYDAWNWEDLDNPEVYRVGLTPADDPMSGDGAALPVRRDGEPLAAAPSPTYQQGFDDCALHLRRQLIQLRSSAVTHELHRAYDKAIEAVEALA